MLLPFSIVAEDIELGKRFTQKGMRRTFNDIARAAKVALLVTKSIPGHTTDDMVELYWTINPFEQRQSISKEIDFLTGKPLDASGGALGGAPTAEGGALKQKTG